MSQHYNIKINQLAQYIFLKNKLDKPIILNIEKGIDTTNDLYHLCLDLFCKGLVIVFGTNNKIELNKLTLEELQQIIKKLRNANIVTHIDIQSVDEMYEQKKISTKDPRRIIEESLQNSKENNSQDLESYKFNLILDNSLYIIHFSIARFI